MMSSIASNAISPNRDPRKAIFAMAAAAGLIVLIAFALFA